MASRTYRVDGMTCGHCVAAVEGEISQLPGVAAVRADLASGQVTVHGEALDDAAVAAAVDEAGYVLVPA
jgi:copper chaperone